jgi:acetyltransferase-like isoleucine patch superfamily enzyme
MPSPMRPREIARSGHRFTRPVVIGDDVWIGIGAIILKDVQIGDGARIGPGAVVTSDVPDGTSVWGNPARPGEFI